MYEHTFFLPLVVFLQIIIVLFISLFLLLFIPGTLNGQCTGKKWNNLQVYYPDINAQIKKKRNDDHEHNISMMQSYQKLELKMVHDLFKLAKTSNFKIQNHEINKSIHSIHKHQQA